MAGRRFRVASYLLSQFLFERDEFSVDELVDYVRSRAGTIKTDVDRDVLDVIRDLSSIGLLREVSPGRYARTATTA